MMDPVEKGLEPREENNARPLRPSTGSAKNTAALVSSVTTNSYTSNSGPSHSPQELAEMAKKGQTDFLAAALNSSQSDAVNTVVGNDGETLLHLSVKKGYPETSIMLIERGADVDAKNYNDDTPLHLAADRGHVEIAVRLIEKGASIDACDKNGNVPLMLSIRKDQTDLAAVLISAGAKVNVRDKNGNSPLHWAIARGQNELADLLVKSRADVNATDHHDTTPLHFAADKGLEDVAELLILRGAVVIAETKDGFTPLVLAVAKGHVEVIHMLLSKGVDINAKNDAGMALMPLALGNNHTDVALLLLERGADINAKDKYSNTPLHLAIEKGHTNIAVKLIQRGADLNEKNRSGHTAFYVAVQSGNTTIARMLLEGNGLKMTVNDEDRYTAFLKAIDKGQTEIVVLLLEKGVDVKAKSKPKKGAAHPVCLAIKRGQKDLVTILISRGADVNTKDENGDSALLLAINAGYTEVAELIIDQGAKIDIVGKSGMTPLHLAIEVSNVHIAHKLIARGANVNEGNEDGVSPLHTAVEKGQLDIALELLNHGFSAKSGGNASSPLHLAIIKGYTEVASRLIDIEVDILKVYEGNTPLHLAIERKLYDVAVKLIEKGADINTKNSAFKRPFDLFADDKERDRFFWTIDFTLQSLTANNNDLWFFMVQSANIEDIHRRVQEYVLLDSQLAFAKDVNGRIAVDIATPDCKLAIQSVFLWHGRYRILESRPEHTSATCFVYKAFDERDLDEAGQPRRVALKLMKRKFQFQREIEARKRDFNVDYVVNIITTYPSTDALEYWPEEVDIDDSAEREGQLTKAQAENLFCIVMPLADRNMFVALKQERFAGFNMELVRHVFIQLVKCVEHIHDKGVLHGDLKPLNFIRSEAQWKLIDLDAFAVIASDPIGSKSSSAYCPPEAIYVDKEMNIAKVKSLPEENEDYSPLIAHPSFDVWALGCILYQLCTPDVRPLFQGGQDDDLRADVMDEDNLWVLAEWSTQTKNKKLNRVVDPLARNLLAQMLLKDCVHRPTLARILAHPFLSSKKVARLAGQKAEHDVFLSYRVASDLQHADKLYDLLRARGLTVWMDKKSLAPGVDWKEGFCAGLMNSRSFVCILSRGAINNANDDRHNYSKLNSDSRSDNVLLEQRFALELQGLGFIEKIFPLMIGDYDGVSTYGKFFESGCLPQAASVCVQSVEGELKHYMEVQALGTPLEADRTVASVLDGLTKCQGACIEDDGDAAFVSAADSIVLMLRTINNASTPYHREPPVPVRETSRGTLGLDQPGNAGGAPRGFFLVRENTMHSLNLIPNVTGGGGGGGGGSRPGSPPTGGSKDKDSPRTAIVSRRKFSSVTGNEDSETLKEASFRRRFSTITGTEDSETLKEKLRGLENKMQRLKAENAQLKGRLQLTLSESISKNLSNMEEESVEDMCF